MKGKYYFIYLSVGERYCEGGHITHIYNSKLIMTENVRCALLGVGGVGGGLEEHG